MKSHQTIRISFFVFTQFSMPDVDHTDANRMYDLAVVHLSKCVLNLAPRYLNPALGQRLIFSMIIRFLSFAVEEGQY